MAKEILCKRCGTVIKIIPDSADYQDPYLPAFSRLCDTCRQKVGERFDERISRVVSEIEEKVLSNRDKDNIIEGLRRKASSRTNYPVEGERVCNSCHSTNIYSDGLCRDCYDKYKAEKERRIAAEKIRRKSNDTDVNDL